VAIQVQLEDHTGNQSRQAKMAENAPVARLIPALVTSLGLPITDPTGRPISYRLSHNNRQLMDDETLATANVQAGDTITIVPEMTAGGGRGGGVLPGPASVPFVSLGRVISDSLPRSGFPPFAAGAAAESEVGVCLTEKAFRRLAEHAFRAPTREVGGILLGEAYEEGGRHFVFVEDVCEAQHTVSSCTSLLFTGESWLGMLADRRARAHAKTLGWYHSHPGHGVFMSGIDLFTHESFFGSRPWYVAIVIDPLSRDMGTFTWERGRLTRAPWTNVI
jgi:proteasome lid subunit RPN8/RPN11